MSKLMKLFICRDCLNLVTNISCTSADIGTSANLELVDKFCYFGDTLSVDGAAGAAVRPTFTLDGVNSGSRYHCRCRFAYGPADVTATHYLLLQ